LHLVWIDPHAEEGQTVLSPVARPTPLQDALILLAGGRAEQAVDPTCLSQRLSTAKDEAKLRTLVSGHLESKLWERSEEYVDALAERIDARLARCCARLVFQHWTAIQRLAAALTSENKIDGARAEEILSG
jgi:hypothetical protein